MQGTMIDGRWFCRDAIILKSAEFRLKAEQAETLARIVTYLPDREWFAAQARTWRLREAEALALEAKPSV